MTTATAMIAAKICAIAERTLAPLASELGALGVGKMVTVLLAVDRTTTVVALLIGIDVGLVLVALVEWHR